MLTYQDFEGYVRTYTERAGITDEVKILMIAGNLWQVVDDALKTENLAWINHERCDICGKIIESNGLSDTCGNCFESE